jgi:hypothetical protein
MYEPEDMKRLTEGGPVGLITDEAEPHVLRGARGSHVSFFEYMPNSSRSEVNVEVVLEVSLQRRSQAP